MLSSLKGFFKLLVLKKLDGLEINLFEAEKSSRSFFVDKLLFFKLKLVFFCATVFFIFLFSLSSFLFFENQIFSKKIISLKQEIFHQHNKKIVNFNPKKISNFLVSNKKTKKDLVAKEMITKNSSFIEFQSDELAQILPANFLTKKDQGILFKNVSYLYSSKEIILNFNLFSKNKNSKRGLVFALIFLKSENRKYQVTSIPEDILKQSEGSIELNLKQAHPFRFKNFSKVSLKRSFNKNEILKIEKIVIFTKYKDSGSIYIKEGQNLNDINST